MNNFKQFTNDKVFQTNELVKAYYHDETFVSLTPHTHNFHEFNIVISGDGKHLINDSAFYVSSGDVFIIPPGVKHGYEFASAEFSIFHLLFNKSFFSKYQSQLNEITGYQILFNIDPMIQGKNVITNSFLHIDFTNDYNLTKTFDELTLLEQECENNTEQKKEHLALYIIAKICDLIEKEKNTYNNGNPYLFDLLRSLEYIHLNYGSKIESETLYKISHMSCSTYIRYFKECFNRTPTEYIQNYRLKQSKSMLKHTDDSLTSIANNCGFYDDAHFCRLFKKKYQMSPAKYRSLFKTQSDSAE